MKVEISIIGAAGSAKWDRKTPSEIFEDLRKICCSTDGICRIRLTKRQTDILRQRVSVVGAPEMYDWISTKIKNIKFEFYQIADSTTAVDNSADRT